MIKFKSVTFYKYSNPSIKNGGFYGESKMSIYQLLPKKTYPKTILIEKAAHHDFQKMIFNHDFKFPFIAKPDVGCRGMGVEKIYSFSDLIQYHEKSEGDYLIQSLVELPNEIGLFYCRIPNESSGKITGITIKNFLSIQGNGVETIEEILQKTPRHALQIKKLREKINLNEVIPSNEMRCLVPYGNHSRGTEFLDGKAWINEKLESTFSRILSEIPGFYYGRLDIRYNNLEELERGENFSIIELNGAKSEPTHIYDPKHSFWFGQKEILRHQKIMMKIVKANLQ